MIVVGDTGYKSTLRHNRATRFESEEKARKFAADNGVFNGEFRQATNATHVPKPKVDTNKVLALARKHLGENSSARACMASAVTAQNDGDLDLAARWALRSLAHSVGILHADYTSAFKAAGITGEVRLVTAAFA